MFNTLSQLPGALYNILVYLATSSEAEDIWKMIKYNDYDALSNPNLTFDEKMSYVWKSGVQDECSVFFTSLIEDAVCESKCVLKIYDYYIHANPSAYVSTPVFAFDFLYGGTMSLVECEGIPVNRGDLFINKLFTALNGKNIGGVGTLLFDDDMSRYVASHAVIGNSKTFVGVSVYMSVLMGTVKEDTCGD